MSKIYLKYGNYEHALGEAAVSIQRTGVSSDAGVIYANREVWTINGRLEADSQSELTAAINSLETAYNQQVSEISLRFEGGSKTAHSMNISNMLSPIQVTTAPSYPLGEGAQYSTFRDYTIQVEGLVKTNQSSSALLFYQENVEASGGHPLDIHVTTLNTVPIRQRVADSTPTIIRQSGRAISLLGWVIPPGPKFNIAIDAVLLSRTEAKNGPIETFVGGKRVDSRFESTWQYVMSINRPVLIPGTRRPLSALTTLR